MCCLKSRYQCGEGCLQHLQSASLLGLPGKSACSLFLDKNAGAEKGLKCPWFKKEQIMGRSLVWAASSSLMYIQSTDNKRLRYNFQALFTSHISLFDLVVFFSGFRRCSTCTGSQQQLQLPKPGQDFVSRNSHEMWMDLELFSLPVSSGCILASYFK